MREKKVNIRKRLIYTALKVLCVMGLNSIPAIANAEEAPMLVNLGVSGGWYEPATSGQGFVFELIASNNQLAAYWFTYPSDGGAREWYLAVGDINGDSAELVIYQTANGVFDQTSVVETNAVGSAQLTFSSCTQANWSYQIDSQGISGEIPLKRIAPDYFCDRFLASANTNVVSNSKTWVDIEGEWLFEGCVNLENSDSHGNELLGISDTTVTLEIDRYSQPDCQGTRSQQLMTFDMQRIDITTAVLDGEDVIANRFILVDTDSGQEIKQLFYVDDQAAEQALTHGILDSPSDSEGFPIELHTIFAKRVDGS
jgi:hypothetical protein